MKRQKFLNLHTKIKKENASIQQQNSRAVFPRNTPVVVKDGKEVG